MNLPQTVFKFIFHFVKKQRLKFGIFVVISIIWATNDSLFPYFVKRIVNTLQLTQVDSVHIYSAVKFTLILLILFWLVNEIALRLQGVLLIYTLPNFRSDIRESVFNYVKSHSHEYFSSNFAGNIAKKLADLPTSCQTMIEIICFQFITATIGCIIVLVMMWHINSIFSIILLIWLGLHLGISALFLHKDNSLWQAHSDSVSTLSGNVVDIFTNILNVRLFSRGKYEAYYLQKFQKDEIKKARKAMWSLELSRIVMGFNGLFLIFGMVFALLYCWSHHQITIGDFTQIAMQSFWLLGWMWFISYQMTVFVREKGTINDALMLIRKSHDLVDSDNAKKIKIHRGEIIFDKVNFSYSKNNPLFNQLNIKISSGEKIGLVGFSGSGKSTFVNLILRFYDLQNGKILIDQQDISQATQDSLRSQISMIPQDPSLFHRSLMENIRYGQTDASDEEVIRVSKLAHCHEFIETLEEGYQSLVGERGIKLSGGQRQRIAIARAILKNAPILILDEATSSLDSISEKLIQESLNHLMKECTTLVIAHRLSTLSNMDRILVFHQGQIIETGTKEELLKMNGHFAKLWNMQSDGFLPEN